MGKWLDPTDARWRSTLHGVPHDFYHFPCYVELAARTDGGFATAYYAEIGAGRMLIPLLIRTLDGVAGAPPQAQDAISPYGYAGPLISDGLSDAEVQRAMGTFIDDGAERGLITTFLRLHPLLPSVARGIAREARARVVAHGPTVSVDLTQETAALDREVRSNHRRNVARLEAAGFTVRFDAWDDYPAFQAAYAATMARHHAADRYLFGAAYFEDLRACLGDALHLCAVSSPAGELACGGLFTRVGAIVQYHLGATADQHLSLAPSKLMFAAARHWGKARGATVLHLGGGVQGRDDSLYLFKRGFGSGEHVFQSVSIVHDPVAYDAMTKHRVPDSFFPLYRAAAPA